MPPRAGETTRLITDLTAGDPLRREAAVARLRVIGARAIGPILAALETGFPAGEARLAAVRVLETLDDPRVPPALVPLLQDEDERVATAAAEALRRELKDARGSPAVLEAVTGLALEARRPATARLAALEALRALPPQMFGPLIARLQSNGDAVVRRWLDAGGAATAAAPRLAEVIDQATRGTLPESPDELKAALRVAGAQLSLSALQRLVDRLRTREGEESDPERRMQWLTIRSAVHQLLAARGSRVALYDLRESFQQTREPLPIGFVAAVGTIGDESCLEPIARAYMHGATEDDWWHRHLAMAFGDIVRRERITRRHPALKRITTRWPDAAAALYPRR